MADPLDRGQIDSQQLLFTIETSIRVVKRFQFFLWAQGSLQALLPHEIMVCACGDIERLDFRAMVFSRTVLAPDFESRLTDPAGGLISRLLESWRQGAREPLISAQGADHTPVGRTLSSLQLTHALAHGCREVRGEQSTFFALLGLPLAPTLHDARRIELLMPHLHLALLRVNEFERAENGARPRSRNPLPISLSARELQVLEWVREGKTNHEIGQILDISPLTVKNHIQKILRKLDVTNRAQAVARVAALRAREGGVDVAGDAS
ncbi:XrtB/PEP-CTERM-associated transcriptional regulator EpsA [Methyloversatilis thermotolerans]|uniref:XrtB/PEP-CTERM-associated transcriptional regulator EpsA n=1 Tax=Methyloversatilis thermotolerans TaxID=1346290 RepID=UPI000379D171|nr:XrtB/PEP-CTERM-associated transcriptional regulator EpsA [Methyloversatilis thermotolerans]